MMFFHSLLAQTRFPISCLSKKLEKEGHSYEFFNLSPSCSYFASQTQLVRLASDYSDFLNVLTRLAQE